MLRAKHHRTINEEVASSGSLNGVGTPNLVYAVIAEAARELNASLP